MSCACESIHKFPCQFPGETEFFRITPEDDREWCRFHLPLQDAAGNKSAKGLSNNGWEEGGAERGKFAVGIHDRIHTATPWDDVRINDTRANFNGVSFPSNFIFSRVANVLNAVFNRATFGDGVGFTETTLGNNTEFVGATFVDTAYFTGTTFGNYCLINGATFGGLARFKGARFGDRTNFIGVTFGDGVIFTGATFGDDTHFDSTTFSGPTHFDGTAFKRRVGFAKSTFHNLADFSEDKEKSTELKFKHVDFSEATFRGPCSFVNRDFASDANFNGAVFKDLVEFHGCTFHPGMSFHQTKFLKTKGTNDNATEALERSYRTLKLEMEKLRARNEEADFFAREIECRRQRKSVHWFERIAATAYKHLSDYGRSVDLPLIWLLILTYAAHYLYLGVAIITCNPGPGARLAFTLEQMFRPFYVWSKSLPGTGNCLVESNPLIIPILASLQSVATLTLLALFLLALRRRFKMD